MTPTDEGTPTPTPTPEPPAEDGPVVVSMEDAKAELPPDNEGSGRFAIFDTTLGQYVGPVRDAKPSRSDIKAVVAEGHSYTVLEV
jgi:hypothetical protein